MDDQFENENTSTPRLVIKRWLKKFSIVIVLFLLLKNWVFWMAGWFCESKEYVFKTPSYFREVTSGIGKNIRGKVMSVNTWNMYFGLFWWTQVTKKEK